MKRTIIALALAAFAVSSYGGDEYRNDAGERDQNSIQLGDSNGYRNDAGEQDQNSIQLGDSNGYRNDAGEAAREPDSARRSRRARHERPPARRPGLLTRLRLANFEGVIP